VKEARIKVPLSDNVDTTPDGPQFGYF